MTQNQTSIQELIDRGGSTIVVIKADDLKQTIREAVQETRRSIEAEVAKNQSDVLLTRQEAQERLSVSRTTLWTWEKRSYLVPIEVGGKRRYKLSDINRIMKGASACV